MFIHSKIEPITKNQIKLKNYSNNFKENKFNTVHNNNLTSTPKSLSEIRNNFEDLNLSINSDFKENLDFSDKKNESQNNSIQYNSDSYSEISKPFSGISNDQENKQNIKENIISQQNDKYDEMLKDLSDIMRDRQEQQQQQQRLSSLKRTNAFAKRNSKNSVSRFSADEDFPRKESFSTDDPIYTEHPNASFNCENAESMKLNENGSLLTSKKDDVKREEDLRIKEPSIKLKEIPCNFQEKFTTIEDKLFQPQNDVELTGDCQEKYANNELNSIKKLFETQKDVETERLLAESDDEQNDTFSNSSVSLKSKSSTKVLSKSLSFKNIIRDNERRRRKNYNRCYSYKGLMNRNSDLSTESSSLQSTSSISSSNTFSSLFSDLSTPSTSSIFCFDFKCSELEQIKQKILQDPNNETFDSSLSCKNFFRNSLLTNEKRKKFVRGNSVPYTNLEKSSNYVKNFSGISLENGKENLVGNYSKNYFKKLAYQKQLSMPKNCRMSLMQIEAIQENENETSFVDNTETTNEPSDMALNNDFTSLNALNMSQLDEIKEKDSVKNQTETNQKNNLITENDFKTRKFFFLPPLQYSDTFLEKDKVEVDISEKIYSNNENSNHEVSKSESIKVSELTKDFDNLGFKSKHNLYNENNLFPCKKFKCSTMSQSGNEDGVCFKNEQQKDILQNGIETENTKPFMSLELCEELLRVIFFSNENDEKSIETPLKLFDNSVNFDDKINGNLSLNQNNNKNSKIIDNKEELRTIEASSNSSDFQLSKTSTKADEYEKIKRNLEIKLSSSLNSPQPTNVKIEKAKPRKTKGKFEMRFKDASNRTIRCSNRDLEPH